MQRSRCLPAVLLLASAMLAFAPSTGAQPPATGALYMTSDVVVPVGACDGGPVYSFSAALPAEVGSAYTAPSGGGFSCEFGFAYTATEASVLTGTFVLSMNVGCDYAGATIELDYALSVAGEEVAAARPAFDATCVGGGTTPYLQEFEVDDTPVAAGDEIRLALNLFAFLNGAQGTPTANWYVEVGNPESPAGLFGLGLPGSPVANAVSGVTQAVRENLTGAEAIVIHSFNGTTTTVYEFNWTTNLTAAVLEVNATRGGGSANITVVDGLDQTVATRLVGGNATSNATAGNGTTGNATRANATAPTPFKAQPGNWTLRVAYENYTGSMRIRLGAPPAPAVAAANTTTDSVADVAPAGEGTKDSPALGLAASALAVAGLALLARRRRA